MRWRSATLGLLVLLGACRPHVSTPAPAWRAPPPEVAQAPSVFSSGEFGPLTVRASSPDWRPFRSDTRTGVAHAVFDAAWWRAPGIDWPVIEGCQWRFSAPGPWRSSLAPGAQASATCVADDPSAATHFAWRLSADVVGVSLGARDWVTLRAVIEDELEVLAR